MEHTKYTKFDDFYNSVKNTMNKDVKTFIKKPLIKHAIKMERGGYVMTREGKATFNAGDYLAFDAQGGQYPISASKFDSLYELTDKKDYWKSKPVEIKMFKTDVEMEIKTNKGLLKADAGDWIELKDDGSYGAPRKPDVIRTDYEEKT